MYKLFKVDNTRHSKVKGFWLDDTGKVYIDNIHIKGYSNRQGLNEGIKGLLSKGEKAVFHKEGNKGIITDRQGRRSILDKKIVLKRSRLSIKEVKGLLAIYKGLTIYNCKGSRRLYFIEVFYSSQELTLPIVCKNCGQVIKGQEVVFNLQGLCRVCINADVAKESIKRTRDKYTK